MPHVKISNPDIIDLAAWQQVINVVNRHDDAIIQLSNNFGLGWEPNYTGDDWATPYDSGSQVIQYGVAKLISGSDGVVGPTSVNAGYGSTYMMQQDITFPNTFSNPPVITATAILSGSTANQSAYDTVVTVVSVTTSGFRVRATNIDSTDIVSINWIAIGPKA